MQRVNPLCPTIRNKSRKIGRNEDCPCGRTKIRVIDNPLYYIEGEFDGEPIEIRVPMKYKHCCGDIAHKKVVARAKQNIANVVRSILGFRKDRRSWLRRIIGFFTRK